MLCKCCNFLTEGIEFRYNAIALCNRVGHKGGGDIVVEYYDDKNPKAFKFDVNKYIEKRNNIILQNMSGKIYPNCEGCMELRHPIVKDIENLKVSNIVLHHWTKCNSHCCYCYTNKDKAYFNKRKNYKVFPILKNMIKNNQIEYNGIINWAGGEVSCLDEFKKISKLFDSFDYFFIFNSSCVKYEKLIEKHLKENTGLLIVSLDCGKKETHKVIKQVNTYDMVWKNFAKYSQACKNKELIYAKYIILPSVNDKEEEIDIFLNKVKDIDIKNVLFDIDIYYFNENRENIPKKITDIFYYAFKKAQDLGLNMLLYTNSSVLFTQGMWKNDFWNNYLYDEVPKNKIFLKQNIYILTKNQKPIKVSSIKQAEAITKIPYKKIKHSCKKYKYNNPFYIGNYAFAYALDFEYNLKLTVL